MNEYISREEVLEHSEYTENFNLVVPVRFIKAMKAADVQPVKRGRWIHDGGGYDGRDNWYHCSECNRTLNLICGKKLENYPYCHCGARMDGEQNG